MEVDGIQIEEINPIPEIVIADEKEVYAFFGLASYNVQCLEKGLVNFAMGYRLIDNSAINEEEWLEIYNGLNSQTFGGLLNQVKKRVELPEAVLSRLDLSLKKRNWLAHDFFYDHAVDLCQEKGRIKMIKELQELIKLFQITDRMTEVWCKQVWASFGIDEAWIEKEMEAQLAEYDSQPSA